MFSIFNLWHEKKISNFQQFKNRFLRPTVYLWNLAKVFFSRSNDANTNPHPQDSKNGINTAPLWGQSIWSTSKRCSCNSGWWTNTFWSTDWPVTVKNNHRAIIFGRNRTNSIARENNKSNQESFVDRHPHLNINEQNCNFGAWLSYSIYILINL